MRAGAAVRNAEFVFLCVDLHGLADAEVLARRIDEAFDKPFVLAASQLTITVSASVGLAFAGPGEEFTNELVVQADMAMYQAKRNGGAGHQLIDMRPFSANSGGSRKVSSDAPE